MRKQGLKLNQLSVTFALPTGPVQAVQQVSLHLSPGEIGGLIGESGCGKSVLGLAVLGLLPPYAVTQGEIWWNGTRLSSPKDRTWGTEMAFIPQNPGQALNPARTIRAHLMEALHPLSLSRREREMRAEELLCQFGFSQPKELLHAYPHQLSGGMQQRVLCALGCACHPVLILADEPTKGLDPDLQLQVGDSLSTVIHQGCDSMLLITHDLALAQKLCHWIAVMYGGQILEWGPQVLNHPLHPYTKAFLQAQPSAGFHPMAGPAQREPSSTVGCPFAPRCPYVQPDCAHAAPVYPTPDHMVRCIRYV